MTLVKNTPNLIDSKELSKPTQKGTKVISYMSTVQILGFVAHRHRVGLLGLSTLSMAAFIVYDKVVRIFV